LTFDGNRTRGKKVTYNGIQEHLQEKYGCKIGYGTVVRKDTGVLLKSHAEI
jgi:hypothetical protein